MKKPKQFKVDPQEELLKAIGIVHGPAQEKFWRSALLFLNTKPNKEILSDAKIGIQSFLIYNKKLHISTVIGADNRHHASNKATKLFACAWEGMMENSHNNQMLLFRAGYEHVTVKEFNELISTLQN